MSSYSSGLPVHEGPRPRPPANVGLQGALTGLVVLLVYTFAHLINLARVTTLFLAPESEVLCAAVSLALIFWRGRAAAFRAPAWSIDAWRPQTSAQQPRCPSFGSEGAGTSVLLGRSNQPNRSSA